MKTVKDVWVLKSGNFVAFFENKAEAISKLSDQTFLEGVPDNTVFTLQPGYQIVDFEVPGMEYYTPPQNGPKLITSAVF